ncbi:MAG: hypothetical protein A2133_11305 [Actinobacteria bacterium RBG_16_64_13]|nr:MAG: hypothetical protein A2133_11305 [Actinobacteria bacterium RBG_16_64_13]
MSRFLDERGRIFGKVNVVDLLVLLVILAVVAFAVVRMTGGSSKPIPVRVTYTVEEVRKATVDALVDALETGSTVRDDGGTVLGEVVEVVPTPTVKEVPTPEGQLKAFASPVFSDVDIVVLGEGRMSGSTVRIGSVPIRVGKKATLVGTGFEVQTVIMHVVSGEEAVK